MHSHHSHSGQFCAHAKGTLEEVVREAIRQGFTTYGLSEHVPRYRVKDLYPEEAALSVTQLSDTFNAYVAEAGRLQAKYKDQINLLIGLETDFITPIDLEGLSNLLETYSDKVEFVVGSIHHVNEFGFDFDEATFKAAVESLEPNTRSDNVHPSPEALLSYLSIYFDSQHTLIERFKPEIIGHFDLCRLWTPSLDFKEYAGIWSKIEDNVNLAISYGALFELNAAAFRKGWGTAYPAEDIVRLIISKGGRFALSDDSHGPHAVGLNYDRLVRYAVRMGITDMWRLERCQETNSGGRKVRPLKCGSDWLEHYS